MIALNPNFTAFGEGLIESIAGGAMLIFDIHKKERFPIAVRGKHYEVEFKTWSKAGDGVLRFDFIDDEKGLTRR